MSDDPADAREIGDELLILACSSCTSVMKLMYGSPQSKERRTEGR